MAAGVIADVDIKPLTYLTTKADRAVVLNTICSLLNTVCSRREARYRSTLPELLATSA